MCNVDGDALTLIYKVVGQGTEAMSRMQPGEKLDALVGLGNGYSLDECGDRPMLIGGGAGVPPMYLTGTQASRPRRGRNRRARLQRQRRDFL